MKHTLLYLLSIFCLAQAANLVRLAEAPPSVIGFWRLLVAGTLLIPFALRAGEAQKLLDLSQSSHRRLLSWISFTGLFFFLHLLTFFVAAQTTTIANCMVLFSLNPLFTSLISTRIMKEKFPPRLYFAYPISLASIVILVYHHLQVDPSKIQGDLAALISGLFYSIYILSSLRVRRDFTNTGFACLMYLITSMFFGIAVFAGGHAWITYSSSTWLAIGGNVLIPTFLGHFLFTYLLKYLNVNWMSCGKLIEPAISSAMAYFLFHEALGLHNKIAFLLTGISVVILFWDKLFRPNKVGVLSPKGPQ